MAQPDFRGAYVVTPHATNPLPTEAKALYVGGTGTITGKTPGHPDDVLISAIPVGAILPIAFTHIRITGTTATLIVALF